MSVGITTHRTSHQKISLLGLLNMLRAATIRAGSYTVPISRTRTTTPYPATLRGKNPVLKGSVRVDRTTTITQA